MFTIKVRYGGNRHFVVNVPKGIDEVTVELPHSGGNQDDEKPLIILTDK